MASEEPFAHLEVGPGRSPVDLWCEDAVAGLPRRLGPGSVDVVVTSPPYNRRIRYGAYADNRPRDDYLGWMRQVGAAVARVLSARGSFFLNVGGAPSDPWLPYDAAREVGRPFVLQNVIHWVKSIAIDRAAAGRAAALDRDLAVGHYQPLGSDRYVHGALEYVFHFTPHGDVPLDRLAIGVPYQDPSNIARWAGARGGLRCRGNTWFLPYPTIRIARRDRPHPASFPPELPEWCLRLHGVGRIRRAADPFVGIGSSAIAAARLGVPFVGFDVDPEYLRLAVDRLSEAGGGRRPGASEPAPPARRPPTAPRRRGAAAPRGRTARSTTGSASD
jgi:site-specific DNA-methyltransferase (adenine-specific)